MKKPHEPLTTGPELVSFLTAHGYVPQLQRNPLDPAVTFPITPDLCQTVDSYYQRNGEPTPAWIREYIGNYD